MIMIAFLSGKNNKNKNQRQTRYVTALGTVVGMKNYIYTWQGNLEPKQVQV